MNQTSQGSSPVEETSTACKQLRAGESFIGKQGLRYAVGVSAESAGSKAIHMQLLTIPPGGRAFAHKHATHETAIYALSGVSHVWHGERLEHHSIVKPGDFFYIPADVPHLPYNPSKTESVTAIIARTDPNEQESVILLPELECIHPIATPETPDFAPSSRLREASSGKPGTVVSQERIK